MSSVARWSYTNVATVWPRTSLEQGWKNSAPAFGAPYQIKCCWRIKAEQMAGKDGKPFMSRMKFWHEDQRPMVGDRMAPGEHAGTWEQASAGEIMTNQQDDMSMFGAGDLPDYETVI